MLMFPAMQAAVDYINENMPNKSFELEFARQRQTYTQNKTAAGVPQPCTVGFKQDACDLTRQWYDDGCTGDGTIAHISSVNDWMDIAIGTFCPRVARKVGNLLSEVGTNLVTTGPMSASTWLSRVSSMSTHVIDSFLLAASIVSQLGLGK